MDMRDDVQAIRSDSVRNWPEDAAADADNGHYQNLCVDCGESFIGHKRRFLCKLCDLSQVIPAGGC